MVCPRMNVNYYIAPPRYKRLRKTFGDRTFKLLDIGTVGDSPTLAKRWLPNCRYFGLDITDAHLTIGEKDKMEDLFLVNLESDSLDRVPDDFFDAIVMSHVLEHLIDGLPALARLSRKLVPGGYIYVEFPSVRSLNLPEARHTLNFSDDATHIRIYDVRDVANTLMDNGIRIIRAGRRREWLRLFLGVFSFPLQILTYFKEGRLHGLGMWDLLGFADFVYARKSAAH
jgi:ubiquinone/menaquinone biosynthesis C-methylase UbiE